jgi:hypothetical protein
MTTLSAATQIAFPGGASAVDAAAFVESVRDRPINLNIHLLADR